MNKVVQGAVGFGLLCMSAGAAMAATDISKLPVVTQELVAPPFLPKHDQVAKGGPKVVKVRMETIEKLVQIAPDGTKMWALTFNGTVPGPLIRVQPTVTTPGGSGRPSSVYLPWSGAPSKRVTF